MSQVQTQIYLQRVSQLLRNHLLRLTNYLYPQVQLAERPKSSYERGRGGYDGGDRGSRGRGGGDRGFDRRGGGGPPGRGGDRDGRDGPPSGGRGGYLLTGGTGRMNVMPVMCYLDLLCPTLLSQTHVHG